MFSTTDRLGKLFKFLLVLLLLAIIAVAATPLNWYYDHVKQYLQPVGLNDISGSAVKGSAGSMTYMSSPLGQAEWFLYPKTFRGLGGKVRVYQPNYDLTLDIRELTQEQHEFKQVLGFIDWQLIKPFMQMRYGQLTGYAQLNLQDVVYKKNAGIERMSGSITLQDFKMLTPNQKDLGQVTLKFETEANGVVVGVFSSQSNAINVSGNLVLQPGRWQLNLDLIPKAGHFELDAILNGVGDARRGGGRRLNLAGFY
ncbi:type II secretion system protein N [Marinicella meishanensis]|uniref:type II secretion system protein N n=1 Tax=Marinicella meishanensis TaxID=2873263 RepID=UPI001CBC677D|nr:type II secretion system protein N [Marinicella sp. NBU2979]